MRTDLSLSAFRPGLVLALGAAALGLAAPHAALALEVVEVVEGAGGEPIQVVVYTPPPEPLPVRERLAGSDIRTHAFASAPEPSQLRTLVWEPDAPTQIPMHDWRARERSRIPTARSGDALATQSWNPAGARYAPSRIRTHEWRPGAAGQGL
jgi:hypothetical protein